MSLAKKLEVRKLKVKVKVKLKSTYFGLFKNQIRVRVPALGFVEVLVDYISELTPRTENGSGRPIPIDLLPTRALNVDEEEV